MQERYAYFSGNNSVPQLSLRVIHLSPLLHPPTVARRREHQS
jgi:hypothetical protein